MQGLYAAVGSRENGEADNKLLPLEYLILCTAKRLKTTERQNYRYRLCFFIDGEKIANKNYVEISFFVEFEFLMGEFDI